MEAFLGLVGVIVIGVVIRLALQGAVGTVAAVGRTAVGKGSFKDNMELQFRGMGPFQIQTTLMPKDAEGAPFEIVRIDGKGLIPVSQPRQIKFVTSIIDTTDGGRKPFWSIVDDFQEPETIAYQHQVEAGTASPNEGFVGWVRVGVVIPEMLIPPRSGEREITIVVRVMDSTLATKVSLGFLDSKDPALLGLYTATMRHHFAVSGYEEAAEQRDKVNALAVRLAVAVAVADGDLDDAEGRTISQWISKILSPLSGTRREVLKDACNSALKSAYEDIKGGRLSISDVAQRISESADDSLKYQAIELCLDVMAADGVANPREMDILKKIASALDLDFEEFQKLKDQRLVSITATATDRESLEALLGLDSNWSRDEVKNHLRAEFAKWNGRLNTLTDQDERKNTQRMLDLIAEARLKYG